MAGGFAGAARGRGEADVGVRSCNSLWNGFLCFRAWACSSSGRTPYWPLRRISQRDRGRSMAVREHIALLIWSKCRGLRARPTHWGPMTRRCALNRGNQPTAGDDMSLPAPFGGRQRSRCRFTLAGAYGFTGPPPQVAALASWRGAPSSIAPRPRLRNLRARSDRHQVHSRSAVRRAGIEIAHQRNHPAYQVHHPLHCLLLFESQRLIHAEESASRRGVRPGGCSVGAARAM